jgi:hypothetical protein
LHTNTHTRTPPSGLILMEFFWQATLTRTMAKTLPAVASEKGAPHGPTLEGYF